MALIIENGQIVGTIDNLEDKLEGKLPIDRLELLVLVNSWGRTKSFYIFDLNQDIDIEECEAKECYDLSKLDVSEITNMGNIFCFSNFNGNIENWDVSNVTNMKYMFSFASEFNGNISNWDVSNVINMGYMFGDAEKFNQPLNFDTSNVTNMCCMFSCARSFNQPLNFDTSMVTNIEAMFRDAKKFNSPLNNWDTSNVTNMSYIFYNAKAFNQNISSWNLDNIKNSYSMFNNAKAFLNKYNSGESLPNYTDKIKEWFNLNRDKMNDLDLKDKHGEEVDNFFSNILLTECNKLCL